MIDIKKREFIYDAIHVIADIDRATYEYRSEWPFSVYFNRGIGFVGQRILGTYMETYFE